jgi:hypothetical protein
MEFYNPERSVRARMAHPIGEPAWRPGVGSRGHAERQAKAVICRIVSRGLSAPARRQPARDWPLAPSRRGVICIRDAVERVPFIHNLKQRQPSGDSMFFVVTGNGQNGTVAVTCHGTAAALEKAHWLDRNGVIDLLITDADGLQHTPADFDRLYVAQVP